MKAVTSWLSRHRHIWLMLYFVIYAIWFSWLERNVHPEYWTFSTMDLYIPFCSWFVIPYICWFPYVAAAISYFFFKSPREYYRLCAFLFTGMTISLVIYTLFPNGHFLRSMANLNKNTICDRMVAALYSIDTPTNVNPSIHVLNTIGVTAAIWRSPLFRNKHAIRYGSMVLAILIILSTMFIKQHSIIDVLCAIALSIPLYWLCYSYNPELRGIRRHSMKRQSDMIR